MSGSGTSPREPWEAVTVMPAARAVIPASGVTVRAVHVIVTEGGALGLPAGANVIVGESHADSAHP